MSTEYYIGTRKNFATGVVSYYLNIITEFSVTSLSKKGLWSNDGPDWSQYNFSSITELEEALVKQLTKDYNLSIGVNSWSGRKTVRFTNSCQLTLLWQDGKTNDHFGHHDNSVSSFFKDNKEILAALAKYYNFTITYPEIKEEEKAEVKKTKNKKFKVGDIVRIVNIRNSYYLSSANSLSGIFIVTQIRDGEYNYYVSSVEDSKSKSQYVVYEDELVLVEKKVFLQDKVDEIVDKEVREFEALDNVLLTSTGRQVEKDALMLNVYEKTLSVLAEDGNKIAANVLKKMEKYN
jgi:hypothetical protein